MTCIICFNKKYQCRYRAPHTLARWMLIVLIGAQVDKNIHVLNEIANAVREKPYHLHRIVEFDMFSWERTAVQKYSKRRQLKNQQR